MSNLKLQTVYVITGESNGSIILKPIERYVLTPEELEELISYVWNAGENFGHGIGIKGSDDFPDLPTFIQQLTQPKEEQS